MKAEHKAVVSKAIEDIKQVQKDLDVVAKDPDTTAEESKALGKAFSSIATSEAVDTLRELIIEDEVARNMGAAG